MLVPLSIPPGIVKNGTPYSRKGRWEDGNLVRWHNGAVRQIGGWLRRTTIIGGQIPSIVADATTEVIRDMFSWRNLLGDPNVVMGSNTSLYHLAENGDVTDITPMGANTTGKDATQASGYGIGPYGFGPYGVFTPLDGTPVVIPQRWSFDNYGELLLFTQRGFGDMYELDPNTLAVSTVTNAPQDVQDILVTEQRIVMALGAGGDGRLVSWSDQEDRNLWTPALDNQAGSFTVQGQGKLLNALSVLEQVLIVGERDATVARYIGPPYVYSFDIAGRNCGAASAEAVIGTERFAVWWGERKFWLFDGALQQLPCSVQDFLDTDVNSFQNSKITAVTNQRFSEVWWFYQSVSSDEVDSYVMWSYSDNTWWTGRLARTAGVDVGVTNSAVWIGADGFLYNHEQTGVAVDGQAYIESACVDLGGGERNSFVRYVYPDTEASGDVTMTIYGRQFSTSTEYTYGPYAYNNPTPTRAQGRDLRFRFDGQNARFEVGTMRLDLSPLNGGVR